MRTNRSFIDAPLAPGMEMALPEDIGNHLVRVLRLKTLLGANTGRIRRTMNYASFMRAVETNARLVAPADIGNVSALPSP